MLLRHGADRVPVRRHALFFVCWPVHQVDQLVRGLDQNHVGGVSFALERFSGQSWYFKNNLRPDSNVSTPSRVGPSPMDEFARLLTLTRGGDEEALGELLNRHRNRLRELAARELGPGLRVRVDASDVVQQTILSAIRRLSDFGESDEGQLQAWIERIHQRNVQDTVGMHVGAKKRAISLEASPGPLGETIHADGVEGNRFVSTSEDTAWLITQVDRLPSDQQAAVKLRHLEGKGLEEISITMGRSKLAVASLIKRDLATLREHAQTRAGEGM